MRQQIESLESRRLLAGIGATQLHLDGTWVQVDGIAFENSFHVTKRGTLVIKGTDNADTLAVVRRGSNVVELYVDPQNKQLKTVLTDPSIRRVLIEAGGGDDVIDVGGFDRAATVAGGAGNDRLWGGRAHLIIGGGGNDVLMATAAWGLPEPGDDDGMGAPVDPRPTMLSGGAGRDTLVAAPELADSLIGGTGVDRLVCTAKFPEGQTPSGIEAAEILIAQDAVTLSGLENIQMFPRKATTEVPPGGFVFNSPFGVLGGLPLGTSSPSLEIHLQ